MSSMVGITGCFAIHRTKTVDGKDAILVVPESAEPLLYSFVDDMGISFERVDGGAADSYLTLTTSSGEKIRLGPYVPREVIQ